MVQEKDYLGANEKSCGVCEYKQPRIVLLNPNVFMIAAIENRLELKYRRYKTRHKRSTMKHKHNTRKTCVHTVVRSCYGPMTIPLRQHKTTQ